MTEKHYDPLAVGYGSSLSPLASVIKTSIYLPASCKEYVRLYRLLIIRKLERNRKKKKNSDFSSMAHFLSLPVEKELPFQNTIKIQYKH